MQGYSIEVGAIIDNIVIDGESVLVRLSIKGLSRSYTNYNGTEVDEMRARNFVKGEHVRFLYANSDNWMLRRYSIDKFLRKEE